ncbi:virulence factor family protein [Sphingobium sp. BYY-5]|uniref:virulence factor family protein n=1 Tax=Sphingobium sp. BYY-5 TaxID=2926400 RepID=UPI001FA7B124|nr:AcvB/VirJ family lysyl-phosphatidylglycerol hydrolase [Sphingobium sp. BYY-5]MCI4589387.1 virulence factor family protein [Sphingobium sp. BYY-5]
MTRIFRSIMGPFLLTLIMLPVSALTSSVPDLARAEAVALPEALHSMPESSQADIAYTLPPLGRLAIYRPAGAPRGLVIILSDARGWSESDRALALRLNAEGVLVAGVSTPTFLHALSMQKGCINPNYAIIDLARDIQHRLKLPMYMKPIILGRGQGGTLAYAALASGPDGSYQAVLSIAFQPFLPETGQWCKSGTLKLTARARPHRGWTLAPATSLPSPWIVVQAQKGAVPPSGFLNSATGGKLVELAPNTDPDTLIAAQIAPFLASPPRPGGGARQGAAALPTDLPLTIVADAAAPRTDRMAVIYSGDGGWVGLDRDVATQLAKAGIPVVGVDSLSYFWSQRTPAGAAADLSAIIRGYSDHWHRPNILMIGYSFGADVLPHIVGHLPSSERAQVKGLAMLGLSSSADFQFHLSSWLNIGSTDAYPTVPAVVRLRGLPMLCIRGQLETDSACPAIPRGVAQVVTVPGGHHFDRNAPLLVQQILGRLPK